MKQLALLYESNRQCNEFIQSRRLNEKESLLVQIVFSSSRCDEVLEIRNMLVDVLPDAVIVGGTSLRQLAGNRVADNAVVLTFTWFEATRITQTRGRVSPSHSATPAEVAETIKAGITEETKGILLLINGIAYNSEALILHCLNNGCGNIPIFGGVVSGDSPERCMLFDAAEVFPENGFIAVLFHSTSLSIHCMHFMDWMPLGRTMFVTDAEGNTIRQINGKSVKSVYETFFGPLTCKEFEKLVYTYPLLKQSDEFGLTGRVMIETDEERCCFTGSFSVGDRVQIGFGNYSRMRERVEHMYEKFDTVPAETLWLFGCAAYTLGYEEIVEHYTDQFDPSVGLSGFLTYSEFTHDPGRNLFLNYSASAVLFSEDCAARVALIPNYKIIFNEQEKLLTTLCRVVAKSNEELGRFTRSLEYQVKKRTEELMNERRLFINGAVVVYILSNTQDWPAIYISDSIKQFGYTPEEFLTGQIRYEQIIHPADRTVVENFGRYIEEERDEFTQEYRIFDKNGEVHYVFDYTRIQKNKYGTIIRLNGYLLDMTERKMAEEALIEKSVEINKLNASLEKRIKQEVAKSREKDKIMFHQAKLALMGEMMDNIAHQWRQPLNIVSLVMQDVMLKYRFGKLDEKTLMKAEEKINGTMQYLSGTIDDFRAYISESPMESQSSFLIRSAVEQVSRIISIALEDEKISLTVQLQEHDLVAAGTANDLKQVIMNIFYNAIDQVKLLGVPSPHIDLKIRESREWVEIVISDNAGGIASDVIDKIFEPYFTTKHKSRGTGLGLYMSKMICRKRLNGRLVARNTGEGAEFTIRLPLIRD